MENKTLLSVQHLCIETSSKKIVDEIHFSLKHNTVLGIVGESGSGKSVTSLAIMGLLPKKMFQISGSIRFQDKELIHLPQQSFQQIRGKDIGMIFQEPMSALNPSIRCGKQVMEVILQHESVSKKEAKERVISLFSKVKLPNPNRIFNSYPHQISGGQKQRVMIAMAIACHPKILIADEPTTALDVSVQKEILQLLKDIQKESQMSIIFISHDLKLIQSIADEILVLYQGKLIESGSVAQLLHHPKHSYTQALLAARPSTEERLKRLPVISDFIGKTPSFSSISPQKRALLHQKIYEKSPILQVRNLTKTYPVKENFWRRDSSFTAVNNVSFDLYEGEVLGLVGESGCGKSTLGRTLMQLEKPSQGEIFYRGENISATTTKRFKELRKEMQIIFQDPYASLNPTLQIGKAIMEVMKVHYLHQNDAQRKEKTMELLRQVGLDPEHFYRYPHEFSGGQRQRITIARAIAVEPKIIVCDESVSALDISVQAQIINLLNDLKEKFNLTYVFISHDLSVVKYISDRVAVMQNGVIQEIEEADRLYRYPQNAYTKMLISASFPSSFSNRLHDS